MMKTEDIIFQLREDVTLFNKFSPTPDWFLQELRERDQVLLELQEVNEALQSAGKGSTNTLREDQIINLCNIIALKEKDTFLFSNDHFIDRAILLERAIKERVILEEKNKVANGE